MPRKRVWDGAPSLEPLLLPVVRLETYDGNPRRGDVERIAESLDRFGQVRPVVVNKAGKIIAGNHTYAAALSLGWTHIAALRVNMTLEEERAYLVADNRLSDLATWDDEALAPILRELKEHGEAEYGGPDRKHGLAGTGYAPEEVDAYLWELDVLAAKAREELDPAGDGSGGSEPRTCPHCGGVL